MAQLVLGGNIIAHDPDINEFPGEGQETYNSLEIRIRKFLYRLSSFPTTPGERRLVVTHGHVLEYLLVTVLGLSKPQLVDKGDHGGQFGLCAHANCGISAFCLSVDRPIELLSWNHHVHLLRRVAST